MRIEGAWVPQSYYWGPTEVVQHFPGVNDTGDKLFSVVNDTGEKFIAGVINLCHGFSVIAGVVDTGEQFIAGDNDSRR